MSTKDIMNALHKKNSWDKWSAEDKKLWMHCLSKLKDEKWISGYDDHSWTAEDIKREENYHSISTRAEMDAYFKKGDTNDNVN